MPAKIPDEALLEKFQMYYDTHGVSPRTKDLENCEWTPSSQTYVKRFGSMENIRNILNLPEPPPIKREIYTDEELIFFLQKYYKEVEFPTQIGINQCDFMPLATRYYKRFGSLKNALEMARISENDRPNNHQEHTNEELLEKFKLYCDTYNKSPKVDDFKQCDWLPSYSVYQRRFGSIEIVRKMLNVSKPERKKYFRKGSKTREELIFLLKKYNNEIGYPTGRGIKKCEFMPSDYPFYKEFGSLKNAMKCAGIDISNREQYFGRREYSKEELLDVLNTFVKEWIKTHEYLPNSRDTKGCCNIPSEGVYIKHFGNIYNAYKEIGYDYREYNRQIYEQKMLSHYKFLAKELGRTPNSRDIEDYSRNNGGMYACSSYLFHFGNLYNVANLCNLEISIGYQTRISEEETNIQRLIDFRDELGRIPMQIDLNKNDKVCSLSYYSKIFGSWTKCLEELFPDYIRYNNFSNAYKSNNGVYCLSKIELDFCNMLEDNEISFDKELLYKNYVVDKDFDRNYRFDFCIYDDSFNIIFIEIFGIVGRESYDKKTKEKIQLCKDNNLPLIDLYYKDIAGKSSTQLYSLLQQKLSALDIDINDIQREDIQRENISKNA